MEVIAIGAELDTVLRADRVLQLWAAAEPGKVIEGLTVKQEISAISGRLDRRRPGTFEPVRRDARGHKSVHGSWGNFPKRSLRKGSRLTTIRRSGQRGFRSRFEGPN